MNQLLEYLIKAYDRDWEIKKSLEEKGSRLILANSILIPIFFGLILSGNERFDFVQIVFLFLGIIFGTTSIIFAVKLNSPTSYQNILDINKFIDPSSSLMRIKLNYITISRFKNQEGKEFEDSMIEIYIKIIDWNRKENKLRSYNLQKSYSYLTRLLIVISIFTVYSLFF